MFDLEPGFQISMDFSRANAFLRSLSLMLGRSPDEERGEEEAAPDDFVPVAHLKDLINNLNELLVATTETEDWLRMTEIQIHNDKVKDAKEKLEQILKRREEEKSASHV